MHIKYICMEIWFYFQKPLGNLVAFLYNKKGVFVKWLVKLTT